MNLTGHSAIVTGGSRGIGRAIAIRLATEGADVAFTYVTNESAALEAKAAIESLNRKVLAIKADASTAIGANEVVEKTIEAFGKIDILVNNAGITRDTLLMRMSEDDWDAVLDTNLKGVFLLTKAAIRPMMSAKRGKIITISSVVGLVGNPGQANYCASKAGVIGFSKSLAKEVGSRGITVNVIAPGYIETDMTEKLNEAQRKAIMDLIPLKRIGRPQEVAGLAAFLASTDADYITGEVIKLDGGMAM
ncbi:MAG: 3-oxoacyl-[acyl-carrier-protein] reductase [Bacteroidota bacterium]|nr:3-oxoacyl-[acyl-carrier-protein] reductase [Bacteroidota bacterium]MDP4229151.1 3-oxoacyl-[acyl-carrier-protein] reductase [Bacteroidota bacterium]MDP4237735.1 3-oxoacyl-[acyl-carrier-protein] reductase [Bacteroidota bacterium]